MLDLVYADISCACDDYGFLRGGFKQPSEQWHVVDFGHSRFHHYFNHLQPLSDNDRHSYDLHCRGEGLLPNRYNHLDKQWEWHSVSFVVYLVLWSMFHLIHSDIARSSDNLSFLPG